MSIIIKGMDMPKMCWECPCYNQEFFMCQVTDIEDYDDDGAQRRTDCPLVEIKTPHGRLVDGDNTFLMMGDRKRSLIDAFNLRPILEADY